MLHHAVLMDQRDATVGYRGSKLDAQSALENLSRSGPLFVDGMAMPHSRLVGNLKEKQPVTEGSDNMARSSLDQHGSSWSSLCAQPEPYGFEREKACLNGTEWESTLFSSSMSEFFSRKSSDAKTHQSGEVAACQNQELVESLEEIEAQTIGNLLPAEDDLFSGVTDVLRCASPANGRDDLEDFDLFSSVGGLELEGDERLRVEQKHSVRKQMNLEAGRLGGARSLMQHSKQETNETNSYQIPYGGLSSGRMGYPSGVMGSSYNNNGSSQILHPTLQSPVGGFIDRNQSSSVPNNLPSPLTMGYTGKQFGLGELNHSLNELKLINHGDPNFHPHSLPEFHESIANGIPYSTSAIGGHSSVGLNMASQIAGRNIGGVGSNGHLIVRSGQVFGSSGNGSSTLPGNHYMWNNSESGPRYRSPNGLIWQNTSFANKVNPHHFQPMPGFPRSPSVVLSTVPSHPHVGSAPVNHSVWDRRHTFSAESPDASNLHLGSLGSVGLPGSSPRPLEIAPHSLFYNAGGMDVEKNVGICSPQQMSHMFPGRNQMISLSGSFESRNERVRNLSHRRSDSNPSHESKKQYELDIDCILRGDDSRTTLMIKNIPNKYTSKMLLAAIDEYCRGTYDFIYLPIDFKNKCNVGYAFINMIDPQQIIPFYKAFSGKKWEKFNSEKVASLAYARIQGKAALIAHFQNSSLMNEDKRCRPILFHTDGPNAGDPEPFPMGTNIRSRLGKPRSSGNEENNLHAAPSSFVNGEDTSNEPDPSSGSD